MIKVICEKCGAENWVNLKEPGKKTLYCLDCKGFFFRVEPDGQIKKFALSIAQ